MDKNNLSNWDFAKNYKYVLFKNNRFFCLDQNPFKLAFYLYCFKNSLRLHLGVVQLAIFKIIRKLIQYQFNLPQHVELLDLPFFGNLCLTVHRGYKIFNFKKKTVVKIFQPDIDHGIIAEEIKAARTASVLDFTPGIKNLDIQNRWYEEDFVDGCSFYINSEADGYFYHEIYHKHIVACLEKMISLQAPVTTDFQAYFHSLISTISKRKRSADSIDREKTTKIDNFVKSISKSIQSRKETKIPLVFSHGDFSLVNIFKTKKGIKIIDWEGAKRRSPLYDFHNYFFTELYYRRATQKIISEIEESLLVLKDRIAAKDQYIAGLMTSYSTNYRELYYLERICMLFERELSKKVLEVILRSIEVFSSFEKDKNDLKFSETSKRQKDLKGIADN